MFNKAIIVGRLGKDPEAKTVNDMSVSNFSVATDESYKNKSGEKVQKTEWINVVAWGRLAEICNQYLVKGSLVLIEGKLQTQKWDKDGVTHYKTEIVASAMKMLGGKPESESAPKQESTAQNQYHNDEPDVPF